VEERESQLSHVVGEETRADEQYYELGGLRDIGVEVSLAGLKDHYTAVDEVIVPAAVTHPGRD
jgi:hypothetical protein